MGESIKRKPEKRTLELGRKHSYTYEALLVQPTPHSLHVVTTIVSLVKCHSIERKTKDAWLRGLPDRPSRRLENLPVGATTST